MSINSDNLKTLNIFYFNGDVMESHPLKFYDEISPNDAELMIKETIEIIKSHLNNRNLKAWAPPKDTEIDCDFDSLFQYDAIYLSEIKPIINKPSISTTGHHGHNVKATRNVPESDDLHISNGFHVSKEVSKEISKELNYSNVAKKREGPIVQDFIPRDQSQSFSAEKSQTKPKSAAKSLLGQRNNHTNHKDQSASELFSNRDMLNSHGAHSGTGREEPQGAKPFAEVTNVLHQNSAKKDPTYKEHDNHSNSPVKNTTSPQRELPLDTHKKEPTPKQSPIKPSEIVIGGIDNTSHQKKVSRMPPTGSIGTSPIDGNDPDIYTKKFSFMPFSYMIYTMENKYYEKLPPPVYLPHQLLAEKKNFSKQSCFYGLEILSNGELKLTDPEILKNQKGLIGEVLQSLMKSIAEGRGVVGVSLPIRIFEPRSLIERICDQWLFLPNFLIPATQTTDPVRRMKLALSMMISGMYLAAKQLKPFNPLLGETFQAVFPNEGITIDIEHTSHHPPVAHYLISHPEFRIYGNFEFIAKLEGFTKNTVIMLQKGNIHLEFRDGHKIVYTGPHLHLDGMMHGDRTCKFVGHLRAVDEKNCIKTVLKFGTSGEHKAFPKKRTDAFCGKIYRYNKEKALKSKEDDLQFSDLETNICDVYGSWLEYLKIGDEETWNLERDQPTQYFPVENPLPSDARFREDLIWIKRNNKKYGQDWKLKLEERQRYEKKLRQDGLRARRHPTK